MATTRTTESRLRSIIREEVSRLAEAWRDDESEFPSLTHEAAMFYDANPDWRDEMSDDENVEELMYYIRQFGHRQEQPWARSPKLVRAAAISLMNNT